MWKDILKISNEEARQDAKRFASKDVDESNRENILDEWRKEFDVAWQEDESDYILNPKGDDELYEKRFYDNFPYLVAKPTGHGFYVSWGKSWLPATTPNNSRHATNAYMKEWNKAKELFESPDGPEKLQTKKTTSLIDRAKQANKENPRMGSAEYKR
jgi:hypothetical protein